MKVLYLFLFLLAALLLSLYARGDNLDDAHRAFAASDYPKAVTGYQAVLAQNGYSSPVLFDLGNSFYREGNLAQAILAYKRAQWLSPGDPDIAANLQAAQKQAGLPVREPQWSEKFTSILSASGWAWLACAAWTLLCASFFARIMWPQRGSLFFLSGIACALILFVAIAAVVTTTDEVHQAVVVDKNATALISPFPAAQTVFAPAPGETVAVLESYHDFLRVRDATGHTGWINRTQIEPIVPIQARD